MTNFVPIQGMPMQPALGIPIPQYSHMATHPHFPLVIPLCDIYLGEIDLYKM